VLTGAFRSDRCATTFARGGGSVSSNACAKQSGDDATMRRRDEHERLGWR
jgi:hypothetical protein